MILQLNYSRLVSREVDVLVFWSKNIVVPCWITHLLWCMCLQIWVFSFLIRDAKLQHPSSPITGCTLLGPTEHWSLKQHWKGTRFPTVVLGEESDTLAKAIVASGLAFWLASCNDSPSPHHDVPRLLLTPQKSVVQNLTAHFPLHRIIQRSCARLISSYSEIMIKQSCTIPHYYYYCYNNNKIPPR